MSRTGRSTFARGGAALAVMAAGIVVVATHSDGPVASASTLLVQFKDADVVTASGATHAAVADQRLAPGDVITTGPNGSAQLATRGRLVLLSSNAALAVVSGDHQQLRTGTAVVDAIDGPGVLLDLAGDSVTIPGGSATEASRGVSVRIGALQGPAAVTSSTGRRLAMPALSESVINGDALPAVTTPLHLSDNADEARVVPLLVRDDYALKQIARGIDTTGNSTAHAVEASFTGLPQPIPNHTVRSERVLPVLIADATSGGDMQQRYDEAVAWRAEGGSWGVVLHLLHGSASVVESILASLQQTSEPSGQVGQVDSTVVGNFTGAGVTDTHQTRTQETDGVGPTFPTRPTTGGTPSSGGGTTAPPVAGPDLLGGLISTLRSVVDGVFKLLPHDAATVSKPTTAKHSSGVTSVLSGKTKNVASSTAESTKKAASHGSTTKTTSSTPVATASNGLLGNLLGGLLGQH